MESNELSAGLREAARLASEDSDPAGALRRYKELLVASLLSPGTSLSVQFVCLKNIARLYYAQGDLSSSKNFMIRAYRLSRSYYTSLRDMTEIHISVCEMLSAICAGLGESSEASIYQRESEDLTTSCLRKDGYSETQVEDYWRRQRAAHASNPLTSSLESSDGGGASSVRPRVAGPKAPSPAPPPAPSGEADTSSSRPSARGDRRSRRRKGPKREPTSAAGQGYTDLAVGSEAASAEQKAWEQLLQASKRGKASQVELLLGQGANPNVVHPITHYTPLHYACWHGHTDIVSALLSAGADPLIQNGEKENAVDTARKAGHLEIVALLERALESPKAPASAPVPPVSVSSSVVPSTAAPPAPAPSPALSVSFPGLSAPPAFSVAPPGSSALPSSLPAAPPVFSVAFAGLSAPPAFSVAPPGSSAPPPNSSLPSCAPSPAPPSLPSCAPSPAPPPRPLPEACDAQSMEDDLAQALARLASLA